VAANIEQASSGISQVNDNLSQSSLVASEIASDIAQVDAVAAGMSTRSKGLNHGARDLDSLSLSLRKMISVFRVSRSSRQTDAGTASKPVADLMPWGPRLATDIGQIDDQHKELVRLVNLLHAAMRQQKGAQEVGRILDDLAKYTVFHFGFEETLFDRYRYPDTGNHKKFHQDLVAKVSAFQKDFNSGKASVTMELMDFLKDWLKGHIMGTDMAYAPFLKDHMAKDKAFQKTA
jgi:hemerythrin-like metal-binding protein